MYLQDIGSNGLTQPSIQLHKTSDITMNSLLQILQVASNSQKNI